mmetsp:Transcript_25468/g.79384  ORF Transcript_25468/g.79384 Transcript_25468/m.79384 type:complete len:223 (+) Transcript_25468:3-671(+)
MGKAGFDGETSSGIFSSIAAVLLLGNVDFAGSQDAARVDPATEPALAAAGRLLGVEPKDFGRALATGTIRPPGGAPIQTEVGVDAARAQRDTVAKAVYSRLFDRIVGFMSRSLGRGQGGGAGAGAGAPALAPPQRPAHEAHDAVKEARVDGLGHRVPLGTGGVHADLGLDGRAAGRPDGARGEGPAEVLGLHAQEAARRRKRWLRRGVHSRGVLAAGEVHVP